MSDRAPAGQFLDAAIGLLERLRDEEADGIAAAGTLLADTVADGGRLFAFGAGHSSLAAQDLVYRAGGLALMNLLVVPGVVGVDQPHGGAVRELVPERSPAQVPHPGADDGGRRRTRHQVTPSARAASTPERQPSSWKPQPW